MATRTKPRRAPSAPQGRFARAATAPSRARACAGASMNRPA